MRTKFRLSDFPKELLPLSEAEISADGRFRHIPSEGAEALERLYTLEEIAEMWRFHANTIRSLFVNEPGVLKFRKVNKPHRKRDYVTLRIPLSVAVRVFEQWSR